MVGRRKVISSPHRRPILPLTTLPSTFRLPRGSRKGGRASPAMWDAIARARPAASCRRHSLEREGDTASRIRSSPLETLIAPRGTDGSNPASSSRESANFWFLTGGAPRYRPFASGQEAAAQTPAHNFRRDTVADEIVIIGKDSDGHCYVLADLSGRYFPGHRHLNPPSALADRFGVIWMVYVGE